MSYRPWNNIQELWPSPNFENKSAGCEPSSAARGNTVASKWVFCWGHIFCSSYVLQGSEVLMQRRQSIKASSSPQPFFPPVVQRVKMLGGRPITESLTYCVSGPAWLFHSWQYTTAIRHNTKQAKLAVSSWLRTHLLLVVSYHLPTKWKVFTLGKLNV
jgi:hypothetical protein